MTSGIPDYLQNKRILAEIIAVPKKDHDLEKWIKEMYAQPLLFKPGKRFHYSNTNYLILSKLIKKITHHTVGSEIKKRFLDRLHLTHTFYGQDQLKNSHHSHHMIHGYQNEYGLAHFVPLGTDVKGINLSYLDAAGNIVATNHDLYSWLKALFTSQQVLSKSQFAKLTSLVSEKTALPIRDVTGSDPEAYGLGMSMQYSAHFHTSFYIYQGMTLGYRALYVYVPSKNVFISVLVNSSFLGKHNRLIDLVNEMSTLVIPT